MPSRSETFGLVMLEAMATGTPVAAFPVEGPLEVVGSPPVGGVLDDDLARAWYAALTVPRHVARQRAQAFGWAYASQLFVSHLVPARNGSLLDKPPLRRDHLRRGRDLRPRIPLRFRHPRRAVSARRADIALNMISAVVSTLPPLQGEGWGGDGANQRGAAVIPSPSRPSP